MHLKKLARLPIGLALIPVALAVAAGLVAVRGARGVAEDTAAVRRRLMRLVPDADGGE